MPKTHFENLQVYQLSEKLSDEVWNVVIAWEPFARNTIGSQLVRSTDSIGANIAEGSGVEATRITKDSSELPEVLFTKLGTGYAEPSNDIF